MKNTICRMAFPGKGVGAADRLSSSGFRPGDKPQVFGRTRKGARKIMKEGIESDGQGFYNSCDGKKEIRQEILAFVIIFEEQTEKLYR